MNDDPKASSERSGLSLSEGTACSDLRFDTTLNSPNPNVIRTLREGDILSIKLRAKTGVVLALVGSKIAGSITSINIGRLIQCLTSGTTYEAVVLEVNGAQCRVEVRAS